MKKPLTTFLKILRYCLSSGKMLTGFLMTANVMLGLLSTVQVLVLGHIVGLLGDGFVPGSTIELRLSSFLPWLLLLLAVILTQKLLMSVIPYGRTLLLTRIKKRMTRDLFQAVNNIPPVRQEINEEQVRFGHAVDFINRNFQASFQSILVLISGFASMLSVLVLLGGYSILFPLVATASSLPVVFIRLKQDKDMHKMYQEQYPSNQLGDYYLHSLTTKDSLIELQIFGAEDLFLDRYQAIMKDNINRRTQYFRCHALHGNIIESLSIFAGNILLVAYALFLLFNYPEKYSISILSIVITGVMSAQEDIIGFAFNGKYIAEATMYGEDFWNLIQVPQSIPQKISNPVATVELKDVCFRYPNQEGNQIDKINLNLHAGETVGIVGENGSGKSTLSKILLGLYAPCEGEVLMNGIPVPKAGIASSQVSCVFQDYVRYELSVSENIWFSMPEKTPDNEEIHKAAQDASAAEFIELLPDKYATRVGSLLKHATQLSGGQWQKLAISRSIYANGSLLVLDEPNASMDVMTEAELYKRYYEQIRKENRIGILISHRLGSTRFCERLLVLKDGKIIQDGSFNELIKQDGLYKTLYEAQSQWYRDTESIER